MSVIREVFSEKNILVFGLTSGLWSAVNGLWNPFFPLYMRELGASVAIIGLLSSIQTASRFIFRLPGGVLADRLGRKKMIVYGCLIELFIPIAYLFARTWYQLIIGLIISVIGLIYVPAMNALIAESLPSERRASAFGVYGTLTGLPRVFAILLGGVLMDRFGVYEGVRLMWIVTIFASVIKISARALFLRETLEVKDRNTQRFKESFREALRPSKTVRIMLVVSCLSSLALGLSQPFIVIYAIDVIGLSSTQWGLIEMFTGLLGAVLSTPGGIVADKLGRKKCVILSSILTWTTILGMIAILDFNQALLIRFIYSLRTGLGGSAYGGGGGGGLPGPAWQAILADLVPSSRRGRTMGMIGTANGLIGFPAPYIGGYLWDNIGISLPFGIQFIIGIAGVLIFTFFVKESYIERNRANVH